MCFYGCTVLIYIVCLIPLYLFCIRDSDNLRRWESENKINIKFYFVLIGILNISITNIATKTLTKYKYRIEKLLFDFTNLFLLASAPNITTGEILEKCLNRHAKTDTQTCENKACMNVILTRTGVTTCRLRFPHAEQFDFNTYECNFLTHECDYDTKKWDLYT
jgi:hypothetical protein